MPVDSKGRPYDQGAANLIYTQLLEQLQLLKIRHTASFSNDPGVILADAANQLASFGVASLYDLAERRWTETQEQTDPSNPDGQPILVDVEMREVFDSKTGRVIPLRELNNAAGDGFTWYSIQFAGDVPILVSWKELTGLKAFQAQVASIMSLPPVQALMLAFAAFPMFPGGPTLMSSWSTSVGSSALGAVGINAAANPLLTKMVGSVAISTLRSGGDLSKAVESLVANEVAALVGSTIGTAIDSETVGRVAAAATKAEITGGNIPAGLVAELGIDLATEGIQQVSSLFPDDDLGTGLVYTPGPDLGFQAYGNVFGDITETSNIGLQAIDYWDIGVTDDGTMIGISLNGEVVAETPDGKSFDITSVWDSLPSLSDLNTTLKGLTQLAVTGQTLTNIIEGKPATSATRPQAGTTIRNADGSTTTYNANGTVTRRLADGRVISSTSNVAQQAQMQNLTPLLAIGGAALLLAS
jgi:hypothetical protein